MCGGGSFAARVFHRNRKSEKTRRKRQNTYNVTFLDNIHINKHDADALEVEKDDANMNASCVSVWFTFMHKSGYTMMRPQFVRLLIHIDVGNDFKHLNNLQENFIYLIFALASVCLWVYMYSIWLLLIATSIAYTLSQWACHLALKCSNVFTLMAWHTNIFSYVCEHENPSLYAFEWSKFFAIFCML